VAVVIPLNNFPGPADDTVTSQTYYRIQRIQFTKHIQDGRGPVTRKGFRIGRSQGTLARTPDVAVVIPLKLVYAPVDDTVTAPL
jgi:hypothetical protein